MQRGRHAGRVLIMYELRISIDISGGIFYRLEGFDSVGVRFPVFESLSIAIVLVPDWFFVYLFFSLFLKRISPQLLPKKKGET